MSFLLLLSIFAAIPRMLLFHLPPSLFLFRCVASVVSEKHGYKDVRNSSQPGAWGPFLNPEVKTCRALSAKFSSQVMYLDI